MTLRDAAKKFSSLTAGYAPPKVHVELLQCVLNNTLSRIYDVSLDVWRSIPQEKRLKISPESMELASRLLSFFEHTANAEKSGDQSLTLPNQHNRRILAVTDLDLHIVPHKGLASE